MNTNTDIFENEMEDVFSNEFEDEEDRLEGMYECSESISSLNDIAQKYKLSFYIGDEELNNDELNEVVNGEFNCMGFAFGQIGCLSYHADYSKNSVHDDVQKVINYCHQKCRLNLREIDGVEELKDNEYCVAFRRATNDDDFHFIRRMEDGSWYEKRGCAGKLSEFTADIFEPTWYSQFGYTEYGGDTVLFAVEREVA